MESKKGKEIQRKILFLKRFKNLIFIIALLSLGTYFIIQTYGCVQTYFDRPTYITSKVKFPDSIEDFPVITLCSKYNYKNSGIRVRMNLALT